MAAAFFRFLCDRIGVSNVTVSSAGIAAWDGASVIRHTHAVLARENVPLLCAESHFLSEKRLKTADMIVTMTAAHKREIVSRYAEAEPKTHTLLSFGNSSADIADPIGGSLAEYTRCLETMKPALQILAESLG